jgi:feruloyl esterase
MRCTLILAMLPWALAAATPCDSLGSLKLPNTTFAAQLVPAGDFPLPGGRSIRNLPAFCRVSGVLKPTPDSDIRFEIWLPAEKWSGRFEGIGNGGFAGSISLPALGAAVQRGSAAASTDTGHTGGSTDATWALGHPQKVADFGYRAIHLTAETAKRAIEAFYGDGPRHSYFDACSNGGRQALMEAQRYPDDYDGIVSGAPAYYWTHLMTGAADLAGRYAADAAAYIPPAKIATIENAVLAACDTLDGIPDGVIGDPTQCHFDPAPLLCKGADSDLCLTAPQLAVVRHVFEGSRDSKGHQVEPGMSPGGATGPSGWVAWITGEKPNQANAVAYGTQFFRNMVYEDASWTVRGFDVDRGVKAADDKLAGTLNATDPDLARFQARGGKLILYHGWNDPAIPAQGTIDYYQSVAARIGARNANEFLRLYMVPGMQHCGGGPGATAFDAMLPDIERWVESGAAPGAVIATKYKSEGNRASGVLRTRPLCPYPQTAHWDGHGSPDNAASFTCQ